MVGDVVGVAAGEAVEGEEDIEVAAAVMTVGIGDLMAAVVASATRWGQLINYLLIWAVINLYLF